MRRHVGILLLGGLLGTVAPSPGSARCTRRAEFNAFGTSLTRSLGCARTQIRHGLQAGCRSSPPPGCVGSAVEDAVELVSGGAPPGSPPRRGLHAQLRCQDAIVHAARRFIARRLRERLEGERQARRSRVSLRGVAARCRVHARDAGGSVLPRLGGPCAAAVGPSGTRLEPEQLVQCLRPSLERIVDAIVPRPLAPSIVLVLTDDQRWDTLAYMPEVTRQLVGRGVEFRNSFVTTSLCCPSRASLYSGQYAHHHGVLSNTGPNGGAAAFHDASTLAVWLAAAGYRTGLFGKYMNEYRLLAPRVPPGWDVWQAFVEDAGDLFHAYTLNEDGHLIHYGANESDYSTDLLGERVRSFIRANVARPFFVVYAPFAPHHPGLPAGRHAGRFAGLAPWRPPNWNEPDVSDKPPWVRLVAFLLSPESNVDTFRQSSLESLLAVDEAVDAILQTLEASGLTDNTLVLFTSDNGIMWGEHWWIFKLAAYEESIRVPLVIRYPLVSPVARQVDDLVLNIDLAPTLAELAGADVPDAMDGRSLLGLLRGAAKWREDFLIENWGGFLIPPNTAVRSRQWKLIRNDAGFEELYDLAADPYELENRAAHPDYAGVRARLAARLDALRAE